MNFFIAAVLVALTGFMALSYEMLWARLFSFVSGARANSFGLMLGGYLLGLALGSLLAARLCRKDDEPERYRGLLALVVLVAALGGYALIPLSAVLVTVVHYGFLLVPLVLAATLLGTTLPLISHLAIGPDERAGARLSYLYIANIVGSSAGSLLTGFWLMDHFGLVELSTALAVLGISLAMLLRSTAQVEGEWRWLAGAAVAILAVMLLSPMLHDRLYERLQWKEELAEKDAELGAPYRFAKVYESKSGVIAIGPDLSIHGGGMYDGYLTLGLHKGSWLIRPYSVSLFHPGPKRVLEIGFSGGAWANIMVNHPQVESLVGIEINRQYLDVIAEHPTVSPVLQSPKATLLIDDGRRWMIRNPDARFDAIVINNTFHFRAYTSNLLSVEFMEMVRDHLAPGGIYLFNATGSKDAHQTAMSVFPYTMMVINNVVASMQPFDYDPQRWLSVLEQYRLGEAPLIDLDTEDGQALRAWLEWVATNIDVEDEVTGQVVISSRERMQVQSADGEVVTDDNMETEY
ncbi:MAG: methyltransferase domain-containing protein [Myxococcota bacterium]|jgi:predicted membrane-bound spermidine synthase|nr:methyltransferase domain-containing protein [Myxococcota bacterium]